MTNGRTVIPERLTRTASREWADIPGHPGATLDTALVLVRSLVMVTFAAHAFRLLLPAAVAAQGGRSH